MFWPTLFGQGHGQWNMDIAFIEKFQIQIIYVFKHRIYLTTINCHSNRRE